VREIFGSNQLRKTLTIVVRETYLTSIAGSAIVKIDVLQEEDLGPPLLRSSVGARNRGHPGGDLRCIVAINVWLWEEDLYADASCDRLTGLAAVSGPGFT
jgi:hypothetical protein